jgi:hypothetical protein
MLLDTAIFSRNAASPIALKPNTSKLEISVRAAAVKEIAERLVGSRKPSIGPSAGTCQRSSARIRLGLKVEILDRLGRTENAQAVRWSIYS